MRPLHLVDGHQADDEWLIGEREDANKPAGVRTYDRWRKDANGTLIGLRQTFDPEDGWCVDRAYLILKGTGLTDLRARDIDDLAVLQKFQNWGGRIRRIDLAIDVRHPEVTPRAIRDLYYAEPSRIVTRLGTPRHWGRDQGETFYLGTGDVVVRCYDKTAERARKGVPMDDGITRFEMQLRKGSAISAYLKLVNVPEAEWSDAFPELVVGWLLDKMRPLDVPRPEKNPQRAPLWAPLVAAMDGIRPVPLGRFERTATHLQRLRAKAEHHKNGHRTGKLLLELVGEAAFLQAIRDAKLTAEDRQILATLEASPTETLQRMLGDLFELGEDDNDTEKRETLFDEGR